MIKYLHSTRHIVNPVLRRQLSTVAGTNGLDFVVKKPGIKANVIDGNILAKRVGLDQCVSDSFIASFRYRGSCMMKYVVLHLGASDHLI